MTQAQSPYQESDVSLYQEPERTSVIAILSLVFGIGGCCLGVTSILAIPLAIVGLIGISRSKGRIGGTGFAIAGLIIGILTLAAWIGIIFGLGGATSAMAKQFGARVDTVFGSLEQGDLDAARAQLAPPAADVPDEQMLMFRDAYSASLGSYIGPPTGIGEWWNGYAAMAQIMGEYQGGGSMFPMPVRFDSGWGLVVYVIDPRAPDPQGVPLASELLVVDQQGNEFRLPPGPEGNVPAGPDVDALPEPTGMPDEEIGPGDETPAGDRADEDEGP